MGRKKKNTIYQLVLEYYFVDERMPQNKFSNYIIQIPPLAKAWFFEGLYGVYMNLLREEDPERYVFIKKFESELSQKKEMKTALFLFKRIVPTIKDNENEPFDLLRAAINDIENSEGENFERLHIFMTISTLRWAYLEKNVLNFARSRNGRKGNSWFNSPEYSLLSPIFYIIYNEYNGKNAFSVHYGELIFKLIKEKKTLHLLLVKIRKNRKRDEKKSVKEIMEDVMEINDVIEHLNNYYNEENDDNFRKAIDAILQIGEIKKHYEDKYRRFKKTIEEKRLPFPEPVDRSFCLADFKETFWKKMPPWNVKDFIKKNDFDQIELDTLLLRESKILNKPSDTQKIPPLLTRPIFSDVS